jgi:hypothetical protein
MTIMNSFSRKSKYLKWMTRIYGAKRFASAALDGKYLLLSLDRQDMFAKSFEAAFRSIMSVPMFCYCVLYG